MTSSIRVRRHPFASPEARHLITLLEADLAAMYPDWDDIPHGGMEHWKNPKPPNEVASSDDPGAKTDDDACLNEKARLAKDVEDGVVFFVALKPTDDCEDDTQGRVGCGALRLFSPINPLPSELDSKLRYAEVKRMFVEKSFRGVGVSKLILAELEKFAKEELAVDSLVIEVGLRQKAAVRLYDGAEYVRRDMFGEYVGAGKEDGGESICLEKRLR